VDGEGRGSREGGFMEETPLQASTDLDGLAGQACASWAHHPTVSVAPVTRTPHF
jgi:hypothetical protein